MNPALKRILLIILLLAVSALIGYGLFLLFKKATTTPGTAPTTTTEITPLPTAGERTTTVEITPQPGALVRGATVGPLGPQIAPAGFVPVQTVKQIISETVSYPSAGTNGTFRYYNANDGKFYHLTADGQIKTLSDQTFYNVSQVTWAKNNDKAVLEYPDNSKIIYNFEKQKQATIPKHWQEFSFSADGGQVAAKSIGISPDNRWLVAVNDDGSGTTLIESLGENADKVTVDWSPSRQTVAFADVGETMGGERRQMILVGLHGENLKGLTLEGLGFKSAWSPTGEKLLYSVYSSRSNFKPELWITDAYGDNIDNNRQMLKLNTWPEKCTFGENNALFCAVPRDLPQGAGILPEVAANSLDDMYKIDLKSGLKTMINLGGDYNVQNISFDKTKNKVYFTDKNIGGVYEIKL